MVSIVFQLLYIISGVIPVILSAIIGLYYLHIIYMVLRVNHESLWKKLGEPVFPFFLWSPLNIKLAYGKINLPKDEKLRKFVNSYSKLYKFTTIYAIIWILLSIILFFYFI